MQKEVFKTKKQEYKRSAEVFEKIFKEQGTYYALAFLYDSQYTRDDIGKIMEFIYPKRKD